MCIRDSFKDYSDALHMGGAYYMAYPRLALSMTKDGTEQNNDTVVYADYFGSMDGTDLFGNTVADACLIFRLDLKGFENATFSIVGLNRQVNRTHRSGNMEWIYRSAGSSQDMKELVSKLYHNYKIEKSEEFFKGAITNCDGQRVSVEENQVLSGIIPTYCGAPPTIEKVVLTLSLIHISCRDLKQRRLLRIHTLLA